MIDRLRPLRAACVHDAAHHLVAGHLVEQSCHLPLNLSTGWQPSELEWRLVTGKLANRFLFVGRLLPPTRLRARARWVIQVAVFVVTEAMPMVLQVPQHPFEESSVTTLAMLLDAQTEPVTKSISILSPQYIGDLRALLDLDQLTREDLLPVTRVEELVRLLLASLLALAPDVCIDL
eukprot:4318962-Prymnesium_polylepis.2